MSGGYQALGFTDNPFNSNTAEREPEIAAYAVHPPYLDRTEEASKKSGSFFLEGARGSGKSATRLTIAKKLMSGPQDQLVVPFTSFNIFRPYIKGALTIDLFATQVAFLVAEGLLAWLSTLSEEDQRAFKAHTADSTPLISNFISTFYLNRSDKSRADSASETYELIGTSIPTKVGIWIEKRWDAVSSSLVNVALAIAKKKADFDLGNPESYQAMLARQKGDGFHDPIYILKKAVEVARAFGFSGILIQMDKVDETDWTGNDLDAASDLIVPILSNINLHEIENLTWTFFVWDEVSRNIRRKNGAKIRFDKIPSGLIAWEVGYLADMVNRRMSYFSGGRIKELSDISEPGTDVNSLMLEMIDLTGRSPRSLISVFDHVLSTHIQRNQRVPRKLDTDAFESGMNSFALQALYNKGLLEEARTISKLRSLEFVTKDVQRLTRQSAQTSRGKIDRWVELQLVKYDGTKQVATAGRPVDKFRVADPLVARIVSRDL
ncbi:hypothetical protein [Acidovorax sp. sic0104]|uniref:hypothetical protein n=1 Tax=Acidovorax sp. sic0104 TaxID=2854784 RepID=UPI001C46FA89|nr:hypothetical protein [Acidovorax sp. sic0104]MBV7539844.1 hypothetical protein [Acidovorax sp. sic0104]